MLHTRSNSRLDLPAALFAVMVMGAVALYLFNPSTLAAADPVVVAAGDIACDPASSGFNGGYGTSVCHQLATYRLITAIAPAAVLPLGDNQYECGGYNAFLQSYALSWGNVKSITHPVVGNHELLSSGGTDCQAGAAGYFQYFGSAAGDPARGYYSYDIGAWHMVALNSNCASVGGCGSGSAQESWLRVDLAGHTNQCILAYWHIPLWSSGGRAYNITQSLMQDLYNAGADVVLTGHDHIYERFAPQRPGGTLDTARGIREFVVGTGGANHTPLTTTAPNSEVRNATTFGVLKVALHATSYDWQFVPEAGQTFTDSGTASCHNSAVAAPTPTSPPPPTSSTSLSAAHLVSPSGTISTSSPSFAWNVVGGATRYALYVNNNATNQATNLWYDASGICSGSTCSVKLPSALPNGSYTWWVLASNGTTNAPWSSPLKFQVSVSTLTRPTLVSPSGSASSGNLKYSWNAVGGATQYALYVSNGTGNQSIYQWYTASAVCSGSTCSVTPGVNLANGGYTWWVLASNGTTNSPWSAGMSFTVSVSTLSRPALVSPSGTVRSGTLTFTWKPVSGATRYALYVSNSSGSQSIYEWYDASAVCSGSTCAATPAKTLTNDTYKWWVLASNGTTNGPWSAAMSFAVN